MADEQQRDVTEATYDEKQRQSSWQNGSLKDSRAVDEAAASERRNAGTPRQSMHACSLSNELPGVTGGVTCGVGREGWFSGAEGGERGGNQERTISKRGHNSGAPGADASAYEERTAEKGGVAIAWQSTGERITKEGQGTLQEGRNTIPAQQYHQQLPPLWSRALPTGPHCQYLHGVAPMQMMATPASARHQNPSNWVGEFIPHAMSADERSKGMQQQDRFQRLPHQAVLHPPQMTMRPPPHLSRPPDTRVAVKSAPAGIYAPMGSGQTWYPYNHTVSFYPGGGGPPLGVSGYRQAIQMFHPTVGHTPLTFGQTQEYPRHNLGTMAHPKTYSLPPGPPLHHGHVQQQQQCQLQHHRQPPREKEQPGVLPLLEGPISSVFLGGALPLPTPPLEKLSESSGSFGSSVSGGLEWEWTEDEWDIFERLVLAVVATVLYSEPGDSGASRLGAVDDGVDDEAGEGGRGEEAMPDVTPPQPSPPMPPEEDVPATVDLVDDKVSPIFACSRASEVAADAVGVGGGPNVSEESLGVEFDGSVKNAEKIPRGGILAGAEAAPEGMQWVATALAAAVDEGPACDAIASGVTGKVRGPQVAADGNDKNLPARSKRGVLESVPAQREKVLSPEQDAPATEDLDGDKTPWCSTKEEGLETEAEVAEAGRVAIGGHGAPDGAASDGAREEGDVWQQWKHFPRIAVAPEEDVPAEEGSKHVHESPESAVGRVNGTPDNGEVTSDATDMAETGDVIADEAKGNDEITEAGNDVVEVDDEAAEPEHEASDDGGKVVKGVDDGAGIGKEGAKADVNVVMNDGFTPIDGDIAEKGKRSTESKLDFLAEAVLGIHRGVPKAVNSMANCDDRAEDDDTVKDDGTAEGDKHIAGAVDYMEIDGDVVENDIAEGNEANIGPVVRADQVTRNSPTLSQSLVRTLDTASVTRAIVNGNHSTDDGSKDVAEDDDDREKNGDDEISHLVSVREIMPTPLILPQRSVDDQNDAAVAPTINPNGIVAPTTNHNAPTAATAAPVAAPSPVEDDEAALEPNVAEVEAAPLLETSGGDGAGVRWRRGLTSFRIDRVVTNHNAPTAATAAPVAAPSPVEDGEAALKPNVAEVEAALLLETSGGDGAGVRWRRGLTSFRINRVVAVAVASVLVAYAAERTSTACARGNELRFGEAPLTPGSCIEGATGFRALGWIPGLSAKPTLSVTVDGELVARRTDGTEVVLRGNVPGEQSDGGLLCHAVRLGRAVTGQGNAEFGARFVHGQLVLGAEYVCSLFRTPVPPELDSADMTSLLERNGYVGFSEDGDLEIVVGDSCLCERIWSLAEELSCYPGK